MTEKENLKLINMGDVPVQEVDWLWFPYIPFGKLSIIQGDPGEGKTTFLLALISLLTKGEPLPEEENKREPINVIYQTAEDGLADTVKPRLLSAGADCSRVLVIDESDANLTLTDKRLEEAILKTKSKLVVLDPIQAYLGGNVDMHRANEIRPIMSRVANLAEKTGCGFVMIGHMNKGSGKSAYRGLGSIDFHAAARSVLVVGRSKENPDLRFVGHCKSSLAKEGKSIVFEITENHSVLWHGFCELSVEEILSGSGDGETKCAKAEKFLQEILADGEVPSDVVKQGAKDLEISERTLKNAKQNLGVTGIKKGNKWYCVLTQIVDFQEAPETDGRGQEGNPLKALPPCLLESNP